MDSQSSKINRKMMLLRKKKNKYKSLCYQLLKKLLIVIINMLKIKNYNKMMNLNRNNKSIKKIFNN